MPESIAPSFVKFEYAGTFGPHSMMIPTREWNPVGPSGDMGGFPRWSDDDVVDAEAMIDALVATFAPFYTASFAFLRATIYTLATPGADPQPRVSKSMNVSGTELTPGWMQAIQLTVTMRTEGFGLAKIVLLDADSTDSFAKITALGNKAILDAMIEEWVDEGNAWSGRDGFRPATLISMTTDLNDALRRAYRMD